MGSDRRPATTFRVGPWQADTGANELRANGTIARIEPKAMEVLAILAGRQGHVVGREELLDAVWPGVVVGDAALTQAIIKLRKALGDDAQAPRYIETIPKRGYRLLPQPDDASTTQSGIVAPEKIVAAGKSGPESGGGRSRLQRNRLIWALAACVALAATVGAGWRLLERRADSDQALLDGVGRLTEEQLAQLAETLPTIAVAPFDSSGSEARAATLAKGIAWELADRLGRVSGLRVVSADGRDASLDRLANVRYLVSGFVQGENDRMVVSAKLVDRQSGTQLWASRLERPSRDTLRVQDEFSRELVASLPVKVSEAERQRLAYPHTRSLEAYEVFLSGQMAFLARSAEENRRARHLYLKAIEIDPRFARAYVGVALTHIEDFRLWRDDRREESAVEALKMADAAYQINPNAREVHWVRSYLAMHESKYEEAIGHVRRALAIDPSYADAYALFAWIHIFEGEPRKAIPMMRAAMRLNPGAGNIYFSHLGTAFYLAGDQEQALINLKVAQARNLADVQTKAWLALSLLAAGHKDEALWEVDEIHALRPDFSGAAWVRRMPMKLERDKARLDAAIKELAL